MFELPPLRSVLDCFAGGLCLLDERGALRCMNKAAEELTGYKQDELMGRCFCPTWKSKMERAIRRPDGNMDVSIARTAACWTPPSRGGDWLAMATVRHC